MATKNTFMRFPGGRAKAFTLSYDDGVEQDIKLMSIFDKYGLKCTFNLNSGSFAEEGTVFEPGNVHRHLTKAATLATYSGGNHEVALHTHNHPHLECLTSSEVVYQVMKDREVLEEMFERPIRGFAYPYGTYNDAVVDALRACGVVYARTVVSTESFDMPKDWLRLPATCHHKNPRLMELGEKFLDMQLRDGAHAPKLFYLWGHSYEFEQNDNWELIDKFCAMISGKDDIWYATNMEIFEYTEAYNRLVWALDSKYVYNPTSFTIWFAHAGKQYVINPGEQIKVD